MKITNLNAREILDSRGFPTIEVDLYLENYYASASIPSGASTGSNEALELRDGEKRYHGKGVKKAVNNVLEIIKPNIINKEFKTQKELDDYLIKLDNTKNKSNLGANAILAVSLAFLKANAKANNKELYEFIGTTFTMPRCMLNILNGGMHADNNVDFQEFMIMPNYNTITEQLEVASEVFHTLKNILKRENKNTGIGDEGGFAPNLNSNKEALDLIIKAITESGYKPGKDVNIALDIASTSLYNKETDTYKINNKNLTKEDLLTMYLNLIKEYPIISIEDPFEENDFDSFTKLTKLSNIQIVGDDLFTTNKTLLEKGIQSNSANAILIKANQIGTITETLDTINLARENNYKTIISHRSGETLDTFISDLAVGLSLGQIKTGSITRGERIAKYNRLLLIEEQINNKN